MLDLEAGTPDNKVCLQYNLDSGHKVFFSFFSKYRSLLSYTFVCFT